MERPDRAARRRASSRAWYARNRSRVLAATAAKRAADPEQFRVAEAARRRANPEPYRAQSRKWSAENRAKRLEVQRTYNQKKYWSDPESARAALRLRENTPAGRARGRRDEARRKARKLAQLCTCCAAHEFFAMYTQAQASGMEVDHRKALALGGLHCTKNLQLITPEDHLEKTRRDLSEIAGSRRAA